MLQLAVAVIIVLLSSALCSGSEAALFSVSPIKAQNLAQTGKKSAVILAAPGGRRKMEEGLAGSDWMVQKLEVYRRLSADLNKIELSKLGEAEGVLSIWTSANALRSMAQRLPPATWFKICQGEWLVISERLKRLARAYGPSEIHLSSGPRNYDLHSAVKALM